MIRSIADAERALLPFVPLVARLTGKDTTLERIMPLMDLLGNPEKGLKIIHIAGTSGKTSTAYYMAALLSTANKRVGLTVSPHVDSITERVQIEGKPISEIKFCTYLDEYLEIIKEAPERPSYFELLYAFSLWIFDREKVDYAVVETGMGGLYDATNVTTRPDKVCVITDIGFDHMHILGHTLPEIAYQKIGIVHKGNAVLTFTKSPEIMRVFNDRIKKVGATLYDTTEQAQRDKLSVNITAMPKYQQRNWLLACYTYTYLQNRDGLISLTRQALVKSQTIYIPGRMDVRELGGKIVVMDGAHNAQKMTMFLQSFNVLYPGIKPAILLAMKEGKEYCEVVPLISAAASRVILTTFQTSQDLPARSIDPDLLASEFGINPTLPVRVIPDLKQAYEALLTSPDKICIITGSFYLLSQIRKIKT